MAGRCLPALVTACLGASMLGGCGGGARHATTPHGGGAAGRATPLVTNRTDLRSPDVDARMDPARSGTVYACPGARRVDVVFDPRGTVSVVGGGRPLVYGTVGTRAVNRACRSQGRMRGVPRGALRERTRATKLTCTVPRSVRFEVHGSVEIGSTVAVLEASLRRIVLAAVLEPSGSRIYFGRACQTA